MTDSEKLDLLLQKVNTLDDKVNTLDADMQEVKYKVTKIDLIIENELRVSIKRVAEGHLDLSRNMYEVMKPNNELEMLAIRVGMLETDMRELKQKIC